LNEEDLSIFYSDSVVFPEIPTFEKLHEKFYSQNDNYSKMDKDWTPPLDFEIDETDTEDTSEMFYDANDEISESDALEVLCSLHAQEWWKLTDKGSISDFLFAFKAVTDGIPISYKQAMESPERDNGRMLWTLK
jgi:hypothetical protein